MPLRIFLFVLSALTSLFDCFLLNLNNIQRKKPLPEEVADIYDKEKYRRFLQYKNEYRKVNMIHKLYSLLFSAFFIFSDFYCWMENLAGDHLYLLCFTTLGIFYIFELPFSYIEEWYCTFHIEEKYDMNHQTFQEFLKDFILEQLLDVVFLVAFFSFAAFIVTHIEDWTHHFSITYLQSFSISVAILIGFVLLAVFISLLSLAQLKMKYQFTELLEGELKHQIEEMMKGCKKKVKKIMVYNESSKSNSKNAFLLSFLWIRMFGIADNFLYENSQRELLAVLAHEIGHLRHKKDIFDFINYLPLFLIFVLLVWTLPNAVLLQNFNDWVMQSFNLKYTNLFLVILIITSIYHPISFLTSILHNYNLRRNEFEADRYAVKMGYGEELIQTFKQISNDELIDVNPSYITEILTYDHPGMYRRIKAIHKNMRQYNIQKNV